jgi:hypothetical protein
MGGHDGLYDQAAEQVPDSGCIYSPGPQFAEFLLQRFGRCNAVALIVANPPDPVDAFCEIDDLKVAGKPLNEAARLVNADFGNLVCEAVEIGLAGLAPGNSRETESFYAIEYFSPELFNEHVPDDSTERIYVVA